MDSKKYNVKEFIISVLFFTWVPWLILVFSGKSVDSISSKLLIGLGGIAPAAVTGFLLKRYHSKIFVKDYFKRIVSLRFLKRKESGLILFPVFCMVISIVISVVFFEGSWSQITPTVSAKHLLLFVFFILLFGPLPEELAWRGYLLDGLSEKYNPFSASIIIGLVWGLWHLPLFFIEGYPLKDLASSGLFLLIYFGSLIPKSIIMTYIYYKTDRSIMTAILFHFLINFAGTYLDITMQTEFIQFILFILTSVVLLRSKQIFFA